MPDFETEDKALLAGEARMLLGNTLLAKVLAGLREEVVQTIEDNPLADELMRDKLQISLQVIKQFKADLYAHIEDYQMHKQSKSQEEVDNG